MTPKSNAFFDPKIFLAKVGDRWTIEQYSKSDKVFSQGDPANAVFYIQKGRIKLTIVSNAGKEAVIAILDAGDFLGEGCLKAQPLRLASAAAMSNCSIVRLEKATMTRMLHDEPLIAGEYGDFSPIEGVKLNGKLTLGENSADNGGIRLAYMALMDRLRPPRKDPKRKTDSPRNNSSFWATRRCGARTRRKNRHV